MKTISIAMIITFGPGLVLAFTEGTKPMSAKTTLTHKEEADLRATVYNGEMLTAMPTKGPWAFYDILIAPKMVMALQGAKMRPALAILLDIVKGGRPQDALLAGGYAWCLTGDPVSGRIASGSPPEKFDELIEAQGKTPRQMLVEQLQKLLDKAGK